jgi:2-haloacid dehalogenase
MNRRTLLTVALSGPLFRSASPENPPLRASRAVAFDFFAVFDPRPIAARAEMLFPGRGAEFIKTWRTRQFEYTWLRTLMNSYSNFEKVTEDALTYTAKALNIQLKEQDQRALVQCFFELAAWPDVHAALSILHNAGVRLVILSNLTLAMLNAAASRSGLQRLFEAQLSTDRVRAYKPDHRAYGMALSALGLSREEIIFAASAGWDAAGAKAFGFPTFWVNRMGSTKEELSFQPDEVGTTLNDLNNFVLHRSTKPAKHEPSVELMPRLSRPGLIRTLVE